MDAVCDRLFASTAHIHGLTKTCKPLLSLGSAIALRKDDAFDQIPSTALMKRLAPTLQPDQRSLLARALWLAHTQTPSGTSMPTDWDPVSLRLAALIQVTLALASQDASVIGLVEARDNGSSLDLLVSCDHPGEGIPAFSTPSKALLWNRVMPRPLHSIQLVLGHHRTRHLLHPEMRVSTALSLILLRQFEQFTARLYGLTSPRDIEYVHEMRVALRRMRAARKVFQKALGPGLRPFMEDVKQWAGRLGPVRDSDVFLAFLEAHIPGMDPGPRSPVLRLMSAERQRRRRLYAGMREVFASDALLNIADRYRDLLAGRTVKDPELFSSRKRCRRPLSSESPRILTRRMWAALSFPSDLHPFGPEQIHALRIECKRIRYAAEFLQDVYPSEIHGLISIMTGLQDSLGKVHDAGVFKDRILQYLRRSRPLRSRARAFDGLLGQIEAERRSCLSEATRLWSAFKEEASLKEMVLLIQSPKMD